MMDEWQSWLVVFDTDRIKQYIFATNRLKEIRGASAILIDLDTKRKSTLANELRESGLIYSAGGGAAALVESEEQAKALIAKITREFQNETVTAAITGISLKPESVNGRQFGQRMRAAGEKLRQAKAAKAELLTIPVEPYMRLCNSCGQHPVTTLARDGSGDWLCTSCITKREKSDRSALYDAFREYVQKFEGDNHIWTEKKLPRDLDAIGIVSKPPNYVGFISLDGNHLGDLLSKMEALEEYRRFSKGLQSLTQNQTFNALRNHGRPLQDTAPFELVLIGGDDVLLITAADIAIDVALSIAEGFEKNSRKEVLEGTGLAKEQKILTMAGGVVLAHADFPIPAMHKLAEGLQKSAKKFCAEHGYQSGALDFLVVSSSNADLEAMRKSIPHRRPYTLKELRLLVDYIRRFKSVDFPANQLQTMYQALFTSEVNAQLVSIATLGRLGQQSDREKYNLLRNFFKDVGVTFDGQLPPWDAKKQKGPKVSALADLVELYPFIQKKGREDGKNLH